eukprot:TRINITY_DN14277_c0_g1_i1.p1 TRINITY_DN14277_c0_g1~~TRINITY_DN14277_c0_g1_i1.p1  ORF type:complete len:363 (-),score=34.66 TRINITY_DN14277_c0_g1_i1:72-1160(-)
MRFTFNSSTDSKSNSIHCVSSSSLGPNIRLTPSQSVTTTPQTVSRANTFVFGSTTPAKRIGSFSFSNKKAEENTSVSKENIPSTNIQETTRSTPKETKPKNSPTISSIPKPEDIRQSQKPTVKPVAKSTKTTAPSNKSPPATNSGPALAGMRFYIVKPLSWSESETISIITTNGGSCCSTLTAKVTHVLCKDEMAIKSHASSNFMKWATGRKVAVITEEFITNRIHTTTEEVFEIKSPSRLLRSLHQQNKQKTEDKVDTAISSLCDFDSLQSLASLAVSPSPSKASPSPSPSKKVKRKAISPYRPPLATPMPVSSAATQQPSTPHNQPEPPSKKNATLICNGAKPVTEAADIFLMLASRSIW